VGAAISEAVPTSLSIGPEDIIPGGIMQQPTTIKLTSALFISDDATGMTNNYDSCTILTKYDRFAVLKIMQ
jgi:hypothetical protein